MRLLTLEPNQAKPNQTEQSRTERAIENKSSDQRTPHGLGFSLVASSCRKHTHCFGILIWLFVCDHKNTLTHNYHSFPFFLSSRVLVSKIFFRWMKWNEKKRQLWRSTCDKWAMSLSMHIAYNPWIRATPIAVRSVRVLLALVACACSFAHQYHLKPLKCAHSPKCASCASCNVAWPLLLCANKND